VVHYRMVPTVTEDALGEWGCLPYPEWLWSFQCLSYGRDNGGLPRPTRNYRCPLLLR